MSVMVFLGLLGGFLGLFLLLRRGRRKLGFWVFIGSAIALAVGVGQVADRDARAAGWRSADEKAQAAGAGYGGAAEWRAAQAAQEQEKREAGFHCLSEWDGRHPQFFRDVRAQMRDPDSFEMIDTRVTPAGVDGRHSVVMRYRARNGFGGVAIGVARGVFQNDGCAATILAIE